MRCNDEKFLNELSKFKLKCECGHTVMAVRRDFGICSYCGKKVYRYKKDEFKDKLKKVMK